MIKIKIVIITLFFVLATNKGEAQINCVPKIDDRFVPIYKSINLRLEPSLESKVALKTPESRSTGAEGVILVCVEDGLTNDFVKVRVQFMRNIIQEYGVNGNLEYLYNKVKEDVNFDKDFASFHYENQESANAKNLYEKIKDEDWIKNWSSSENYDISSFDRFFNFWIKGSQNKDSVDFIIHNNNRILYAHKSVIENVILTVTESGPDFGAEYYTNKIEEFINLKKENSCSFNSSAIYTHLEILAQILIENNQPFEAIKKINLYQPYLTTELEKYQISYLKMLASYYDDNLKGTIEIGSRLIEAYKKKKIVNRKENPFGDIDMSTVYGIMISSLSKLELFQEAMTLSNECAKNKSIQHNQYVDYHARLLRATGKLQEACKFLNNEYMKGNESAREIYLEVCK